MKLERSAHRLFLNTKGSSSPEWYWVGKDIDDFSVEMNGSFESKTNIQGQTTSTDTGYEPTMEATPYYADPEDPIYDFLENLALNRKSGDTAKCEYMEVVVKDTKDSSHKAWREDCVIEIGSYGGNTEGFTIEYTIHPTGNRTQGTVTFADKIPTFSPGSSL